MIEIIKKGPEKFITTCQKCGTKFSYELEDLWSILLSPYLCCPVCGEHCYHHIKNVEEESTTNIDVNSILNNTTQQQIIRVDNEDLSHITEVHLKDVSTSQLRAMLDKLEQYYLNTKIGKQE